jgi:hypothetical protein
VGGGDGAAASATLGGRTQAGPSGAEVAALPRFRRQRWRRRFPATAVVEAGTGTWQDTVNDCTPATALKTRQAFKPLAKQWS